MTKVTKTSLVGLSDYKWVYPSVDDTGAPLTNLQGAWVEVRRPGEAEFEDVAFVPFPKAEITLEFPDDGAYAVRHSAVSNCTRSEPSEAIAVYIDRRPPAKPASGSAKVHCAHPEGLDKYASVPCS